MAVRRDQRRVRSREMAKSAAILEHLLWAGEGAGFTSLILSHSHLHCFVRLGRVSLALGLHDPKEPYSRSECMALSFPFPK